MKVDISRIKKQLRPILNVFWEKLFLVFILFAIIDFLVAGIFFHSYYLKSKSSGPVTPLLLSVNQSLLDGVFSKWDEREVKFEESISSEFPNFFREIVSPSIAATSTEEAATPSEE